MEIRNNDDGKVDEIVGPATYFHCEQMDKNVWWLCVEMPDGKRLDVNFVARGAISCYAEIGPSATDIKR